MLFQPDRHEPVCDTPWSEQRARETIEWIVRETEAAMSPEGTWPTHPQDAEKPDPPRETMFYLGATGVIWALHYLQALGAARLQRDLRPLLEPMIVPNRVSMDRPADRPFGSYMMGDTPARMTQFAAAPSAALADEIALLVRSNLDDPTRELMWGSPGTMLAALLMHRHTGEGRWSALYLETARKLHSQLEWSAQHQLHFWSQDMYGQHSDYLDAVHGFVATALPLLKGLHLFEPSEREEWTGLIANTIRRTAEWEGPLVNWRAWLSGDPGKPKLMQYCHGAPGFVICLADFPGDELDDLLIAGGEATWAAGPLRKGSNLCHGTGGNGYAFLKLHERTGDPLWLDRARAFAMHGIAQTEAARREHGQMRHSLWTGDPGFAIYLRDCIHGTAQFPTLDVFFA